MLKALILVSALVAAVAAAPSKLTIVPGTSPKLTAHGVFGIVEGIIDCGSAGRLGPVTVPDCTLVPCTFNPNSVYDIEIRFTASLTSSSLSLHVYKLEGAVLLLEVPIPGEIQAGIEYDLRFPLAVTTEYSGQQFDMRFYILDLETQINEICAEAAVRIT